MQFGKLVPQFFYDLISRVLPGGVAIVMGSWAADSSLGALLATPLVGAPALEKSAFVFMVMLFVACYLCGQLLSPISDFYERYIVRRIFSKYFTVIKQAIDIESSDYTPHVRAILLEFLGIDSKTDSLSLKDVQVGSALFVLYDWVRINNSDAGARLAKTRAEYRMFGALAVIQVMVAIEHALHSKYYGSTFHEELIIANLLLFAITTGSLVRTYWLFQRAVINTYYSVKASADVDEDNAETSLSKKTGGEATKKESLEVKLGTEEEVKAS